MQAAIFADPGRRAIDCSRLSAWAALHREARSLRARSENVVAMGFRFRFTVVICYAVCSREHESDKFVEVEMASKNDPVSYTHLDVYKRQLLHHSCRRETPADGDSSYGIIFPTR